MSGFTSFCTQTQHNTRTCSFTRRGVKDGFFFGNYTIANELLNWMNDLAINGRLAGIDLTAIVNSVNIK